METGAGTESLADAIRKVLPGDLRTLFLRNLLKAKRGEAFVCASAVRKAQIGLRHPEEGLGQLEVDGVLGDGSFGVITAVHHTVLPGEYALKTLKEVSPAMQPFERRKH